MWKKKIGLEVMKSWAWAWELGYTCSLPAFDFLVSLDIHIQCPHKSSQINPWEICRGWAQAEYIKVGGGE